MGKIITDSPIAHKEGILSHPEGVDLLPANIELSGMEVSLINAMINPVRGGRETILKQYLDTVKKDYQYILLDTQPSLGMLTVNALAAADSVIIPVQAQYLPATSLKLDIPLTPSVRGLSGNSLAFDGETTRISRNMNLLILVPSETGGAYGGT